MCSQAAPLLSPHPHQPSPPPPTAARLKYPQHKEALAVVDAGRPPGGYVPRGKWVETVGSEAAARESTRASQQRGRRRDSSVAAGEAPALGDERRKKNKMPFSAEESAVLESYVEEKMSGVPASKKLFKMAEVFKRLDKLKGGGEGSWCCGKAGENPGVDVYKSVNNALQAIKAKRDVMGGVL